jgi:hypothetical protein
MELNFSMSESDCIVFSEEYHRNSPVHRRARTRARWTVPIIFSIFMVISFALSGPTIIATVFFPIIIGWITLYPKRFDTLVRNNIRNRLKESSHSKTFGEYQVEINQDGIVSTGPTGRSEHTWASVDRINLTPDYLFVFFAGLSGLPIPISQIGPDHAEAAYDLLESHLANVA